MARGRSHAPTAALAALACALLAMATTMGPWLPRTAQADELPGSVDLTWSRWSEFGAPAHDFGSTPIFELQGGKGIAYCTDPRLWAPKAGSYQTSSLHCAGGTTTDRTAELRAILYYGWGGAGFDASMWPDAYEGGKAWTPELYYGATHVLVSYAYCDSAEDALYGCSPELSAWFERYVIGRDGAGERQDSVLSRMLARSGSIPDTFSCFCVESQSGGKYQVLAGLMSPGKIAIEKGSSDAAASGANGCYSLAGAAFGIYTDAGCTRQAASLVTDSQGKATSAPLPPGTYYLRETEAPKGFALSDTVHVVKVSAASTTALGPSDLTDAPFEASAPLLLKKADAVAAGEAQGDASLAGARFEVCYYKGLFEESDLPDKADRTWTLESDEAGDVRLDDGHLVSGDEPYRDAAGSMALPLGTVTIRETQAPQGYEQGDGKARMLQVIPNAEGSAAEIVEVGAWDHAEDGTRIVLDGIELGGLSVEKADAETGKQVPLGGATLEGAVLTVSNASKAAVCVGGMRYEPGADVLTITTDEKGHASTAIDALPYGTYEVRETTPPKGYLPSDAVLTIEVHGPGELAESDIPIEDQVVRGDLRLSKVDARTQAQLAGVSFRLTSMTTGESHVIVTDENGVADTSSSWFSRTAPDEGAEAAKSESAPGPIWFAGAPDDPGTPTDDHGALPYDAYLLEELPGTANAGHTLVRRTVVISRDGTVVDLGTLEDAGCKLGTTALDRATESHAAKPSTETTIDDVVEYSGLTPGKTYELTALLVDAGTGEPITEADGNAVVAKAEFVPEEADGEQTVSIAFDSSGLAGTEVVVFESLSDADGNWVGSHEDLGATSQTVTFGGAPQGGKLAQTGVNLPIVPALVGAAALGGLAAWLRPRRHRR